MKTIAGLSTALLVLCAALSAADPALDRAALAEQAGKDDVAASTYLQWLRANPSSTDAPAVFASYYRTEKDLSLLLQESHDFLAQAKGVPGAAAQFVRIARLFELAGLTEEARDAWLSAAAEGAPGPVLVSAALLSLELNDADSLGRIRAAAADGPFAPLVSALAAVQAGDYPTARQALTVAAQGDPQVVPKALWVLYRTSAASGDAATAAFATGELTRRYPGSPEAALLPGDRPVATGVARPLVSPSPFELLGVASSPPTSPGSAAPGPTAPAPGAAAPAASAPSAAAPASPAPGVAPGSDPGSPGPDAAAPQTFVVQAGSFLVRENADYLAADLRAKGFDPTVRQDTWQGKDRYRVLAGIGLTREGANALLSRLTSAGYSGFLAADPPPGR